MTGDRQATNLFPALDDWLEAWTSTMRSASTGAPAELAARLLDPRNWLGVGSAALEQPFETVLGLPRLADVPDLDRKLLGLLQCWAGVTQRSAEYSAIVAQIWMSAYADFLPALQAAAGEGKPATGGRELLDRWTATVNERLLKAQRSEDFLAAQRRLLDALLQEPGGRARAGRDRRQGHGPADAQRDGRRPQDPARPEAGGAPAQAAAGRRGGGGQRLRRPAEGRRGQREERARQSMIDIAPQAALTEGWRDAAQAARRSGPARPGARRRRADRHHAQGRGAADRQDGALPLPADGREAGAGAGPAHLRPGRALHHDGPAGGPLAGPQPAARRARRLCRRLGPPGPGRPLCRTRRLCERLSRGLCRRDAPAARGRRDQPARRVPGRRDQPVLHGPPPDPHPQPDHDRHSGRLPCRPDREPDRSGLHERLGAQPGAGTTSTVWSTSSASCPASSWATCSR